MSLLVRSSPAYTVPYIKAGGYKIQEATPVITKETQSAQGFPVRTFAPQPLTTITVEFVKGLTIAQANAIQAALTFNAPVEFQFWSNKYNAMMKANFYSEVSEIPIISSLGSGKVDSFTCTLTQAGLISGTTVVRLSKQPTSVVSNNAWSNPTNVYADDGSYATNAASSANTWYDLVVGGFDFSAIPDGSVINSVYVNAQYKMSTTASQSITACYLMYSGAHRGSDHRLTQQSTSDINQISSDTGVWTVAQLKSGNLQACFTVNRQASTACTYSCDFIAVDVYYT